MFGPNLEDSIGNAGDPMRLLWKPDSPPAQVPVVPPEFEGWAEEQRSWLDSVALMDLSHHMVDTFIEGPDATRMLSAISANNYVKFAIGQAKQFVSVTEEGHLVQDGILARFGDNKYSLIGIGGGHNWVAYHAANGGYDVQIGFDPTSEYRQGDPVLFRYQLQGPKAAEMLHEIFGDALDDIKFFHFREVELDGVKFNALRHGMAGQAGFEFFGPWEHQAKVHGKFLEIGKKYDLKQVGGLCYYTVGVDSGWLATPVAGIYTAPGLEDYRKSVPLYSYEGMAPLYGSFYSPNIEDYYASPFELGYGRSVAFNHDFIGKAALEKTKDNVPRTKVTLVWNKDDVARLFGKDLDFFLTYSKDRVEADGELVGLSQYATHMSVPGEIHSLALVKNEFAVPGTELTLVWGQHPGPDAKDEDIPEFDRIRVRVETAPYDEHARNEYRKD